MVYNLVWHRVRAGTRGSGGPRKPEILNKELEQCTYYVAFNSVRYPALFMGDSRSSQEP